MLRRNCAKAQFLKHAAQPENRRTARRRHRRLKAQSKRRQERHNPRLNEPKKARRQNQKPAEAFEGQRRKFSRWLQRDRKPTVNKRLLDNVAGLESVQFKMRRRNFYFAAYVRAAEERWPTLRWAAYFN